MKYYRNKIAKNKWVINPEQRDIPLYLDMWSKTPSADEYKVWLLPLYYVYSISRIFTTRLVDTAYIEYFNAKKGASYQIMKNSKIPNQIEQVYPMSERVKTLGTTTGNVIVSNGIEYIEVEYTPSERYLTYLSREFVGSIPVSTRRIEDVKDKIDKRLLYSTGNLLQVIDTNGILQPEHVNRKFAFIYNKQIKKYRKVLVCATSPNRVYIPVNMVHLSDDIPQGYE